MNRKIIAGTTLTLFLIVAFFSAVPVVLASAPAMPSVAGPKGEIEWDVQTLWNFCRFVLEFRLGPKVAVVSENLTMWDELHENMTDPDIYPNPNILGPYANVTYSARVSVDETDFSDVFGNVSASGARLLIHLFSTQAGINFTKQWAESGVKAVLVGINVEAQNLEYWQQTEGKCEYETVLASSVVVQWQKSPVTEEAGLGVVWPRDQVYSKKWRIPPWIYPLAETDFNYDGKVDFYDLIILGYAWMSKPGDPRWNLECDIDGNFIINVADLCRLAKDYGKTAEFAASVQTASSAPKITQTNSETLVYLDPPTINATEDDVQTGRTFTVYINISDAVEIYGWQAGLTFNSTLLECTDFFEGEFLQSGGKSTLWEAGSIDNEAGVITPFGCTLLNEGVNASGSGQLAYLRFKANAPGVSDLHLRDVKLTNSSNVFKLYPFNIIDTYTVTRSPTQTSVIVSNSTDQSGTYGSGFYGHAFSHPHEELSFNVTGPYPGFSNVTIPKTLINVSNPDLLLVIIDDKPLKAEERTLTENATHYLVYFTYNESIHNVRILERPPVYNINADRYYATIQEAIDAPETSHGHEILAYAGIHYEHVVVNKPVTLIGQNKHNTTIDGSGTGTVIKITVNNVNISGFTIQNSGNPEYGILVDGSNNNITNNIITNNHIGICLNHSSGNTLTNNNMSCNEYNFGLYGAEGSHFNNTIDENNTVDGKPVYYVKKASNTVYDSSTNAGTFYLIDCNNVTIRDLTLTKNVNGIFLWNTTNSKIQNVTASNNLNGIYLQSSNNNTVYHNSFIENTIQAKVTESYNNHWNTSYLSGGGNYWSEYIYIDYCSSDFYSGPYQNETGNDGIWDHEYKINENNVDNYPLISPLTPPVFNIYTRLGYAAIQEAIDASQTIDGHTIIVRNGTDELVTINKSLTLIGIIGSTIIDGNGTGTVVTITANNVTLIGFTIQGSGSSMTDRGIFLSHSNNTVISRNTITNNEYGISLDDSHGCIIRRNDIRNNNAPGIYLSDSSNNEIYGNNVTYNYYGIYLLESNDNTIYHNNFINNDEKHAHAFGTDNEWNITYPYGGNYWSNYTSENDCSGPYQNETGPDHIWDHPYEEIDGNNIDEYPLVEPWKPTHDLTVVSVAPYKTVVGQGYSMDITVTLENKGDYPETFNVTVYYDDNAITLPNGKNYTTITLTSENSIIITVTFTWNTTGVSYGNYTISANATIVEGETDTTDNTYPNGWVVVSVVGDVDGDGMVGSIDLGKLGAAYGSMPGQPNWNPEADLDGSGAVGSIDLGKLGANYGKYC